MSDENAQPNLFGFPLEAPKERRGRKAHRWTQQVAERIVVSRALGRTQEEIGEIVHLSVPTLRKVYFAELDRAAEILEAALDESIVRRAIVDGVVGAQRLLKEQLARGKAAVPIAKQRTRKEQTPGKKAQADVDAVTAHEGTSWGEVLKH